MVSCSDSSVGSRIDSQMQEVRGSNPRLGGLGVSPFQASGGMSTLQSSASGLHSSAQGIPFGPNILLRVKHKIIHSSDDNHNHVNAHWRRHLWRSASAHRLLDRHWTVEDVRCLFQTDHSQHYWTSVRKLQVCFQRQTNTPLKADHPERPTMTLGWSLEHPLGIRKLSVCSNNEMVSRSGGHRNRGVFICSQCFERGSSRAS